MTRMQADEWSEAETQQRGAKERVVQEAAMRRRVRLSQSRLLLLLLLLRSRIDFGASSEAKSLRHGAVDSKLACAADARFSLANR